MEKNFRLYVDAVAYGPPVRGANSAGSAKGFRRDSAIAGLAAADTVNGRVRALGEFRAELEFLMGRRLTRPRVRSFTR